MASVTTKSARSLTARSPKRSRAQVTLTTQATVGELIEIPGMDLDALVLTQCLFLKVSELQVASTASSRCRTASMASTRPSERLRVS